LDDGLALEREKALVEEVQRLRAKATDMEVEHLTRVKRLEKKVSEAQCDVMRFEVEQMNIRERLKQELSVRHKKEVDQLRAEALFHEQDAMHWKRVSADAKERLECQSRASQRRIESHLQRSRDVNDTLIATLGALREVQQRPILPTDQSSNAEVTVNEQQELVVVERAVAVLSTMLEKTRVSSGVCAICMDNPPDVLLMPCRHLSLCADCGDVVIRCPICRESI